MKLRPARSSSHSLIACVKATRETEARGRYIVIVFVTYKCVVDREMLVGTCVRVLSVQLVAKVEAF